MGYSIATTLTLPIHLYGNYARILATDLAANNQKLSNPFNPNKLLESLYTRLNERVDYATTAGNPIAQGQVVSIEYDLVAEMGQLQEYCRTWNSKLEPEKPGLNSKKTSSKRKPTSANKNIPPTKGGTST